MKYFLLDSRWGRYDSLRSRCSLRARRLRRFLKSCIYLRSTCAQEIPAGAHILYIRSMLHHHQATPVSRPSPRAHRQGAPRQSCGLVSRRTRRDESKTVRLSAVFYVFVFFLSLSCLLFFCVCLFFMSSSNDWLSDDVCCSSVCVSTS